MSTCECGEAVLSPDDSGREVRFILGHSRRGHGRAASVLAILGSFGPLTFAEIHTTVGGEKNSLSTLLSRMSRRAQVHNIRKVGWALPGQEIGESRRHSGEKIACDCGCGETRLRYDAGGKERRYILGHQARRRTA